MPIADRVLKAVAALFHIPPDALDYYIASRSIGRGAETLLPFPAELIPIGARLVLRGWMNNKFLPTNRDWVLPYWAERQFDPQDPAFMPRGLNLYTINYTHRDWTMIGNLGREREAIVDPRGLVTPWFDGWSLDVWAEVNGKSVFPSRLPDSAVEQTLHENLPIVITRFRCTDPGSTDVQVTLRAYGTLEKDASEWLIQEIALKNLTAVPCHPTIYLAVRPFNPEGVSLIKDLRYRPLEGIGGAFFVEGALGVLLPQPGGVACSDFAAGDVALALPALNGSAHAVSPEGLATGVAAYQFELGGGETRSFAVRMPVRKIERDEDDPDLLPYIASLTSTGELGSQTIATWRDKSAHGMRVRLPDETLASAFEANKAYLLLLHDGDTITPGPYTYHQFWFRDAAFLLNALDKVGYHAEVRQVLDRFPWRLEKDGYLRATEGEWDSNGAAIWTTVENARLTGERELVARNYWSLLRMAAWINSKRQLTKRKQVERMRNAHDGLLPPGPGAEHLGPPDYYYWDDFWGLAGLRDMTQVAEWMGQDRDATRLRANLDAFRADVDGSLAAAAARLGRPAMPASPYRRLDAGMIGNLAALYPLRLFGPDDPRIVDTLAGLREIAWMEDAYFSHVGHSALGTYLSLHVAECYLFQRNPDAWKIINWVLRHASPTFTWAEGIHPVTRRGGMGDGHHGWAAADFVLALRNALLFEEQDHLVITPVLPEDWTAENNVLKVEDAPTYFGRVSYTIAFGQRTGTLVLDADWREEPVYVEWDLPFAPREAGGEPHPAEIIGNTVRLPRGVTRAVVTW